MAMAANNFNLVWIVTVNKMQAAVMGFSVFVSKKWVTHVNSSEFEEQMH